VYVVELLPFALRNAPAIDDEVVSFTQSGGWQKLEILWPLLYRRRGWLRVFFADWTSSLHNIADRLKVSRSSLRRGGL
jgi:hypothetical protein